MHLYLLCIASFSLFTTTTTTTTMTTKITVTFIQGGRRASREKQFLSCICQWQKRLLSVVNEGRVQGGEKGCYSYSISFRYCLNSECSFPSEKVGLVPDSSIFDSCSLAPYYSVEVKLRNNINSLYKHIFKFTMIPEL